MTITLTPRETARLIVDRANELQELVNQKCEPKHRDIWRAALRTLENRIWEAVNHLNDITNLCGVGESLFSAPSDNMEPEILQGGSVVVDISQNTFTANGIYAMTYQGSAFIYRIQMNPDGSVYFLSDNPKYEKMVVKDTSNIVIVGRCVGCCNTHSL